ERLAGLDVNAAARGIDVVRAVELHAAGSGRDDHAVHRRDFLARADGERDRRRQCAVRPDLDRRVGNPLAVDASFERTRADILVRNRRARLNWQLLAGRTTGYERSDERSPHSDAHISSKAPSP